ncbi:MAG: hypothetical protein U0074_05370 [Kouleothrix sp.]
MRCSYTLLPARSNPVADRCALRWSRWRLWLYRFQPIKDPVIMAHSGNFILRLAAIALGTGFHWYDLLAYAIGIMSAALADMFLLWRPLRNV